MKLFLAVLINFASALYFEINERDKKCFIEELPDDTQMIGKYLVQVFDKNDKVTYFDEFFQTKIQDLERVGARLWNACWSSRSKR